MSSYGYAVRHFVFPVLGSIYNREFIKLYRELRQSQYWSAEQLQEYRWQRFKKLVAHAAESVPFYRDYFRKNHLRLASFDSFGDLANLPVLERGDYHRIGLNQFISERSHRRELIRESTSGTSGQPFSFYIDRTVVASKMARLLRENEWAGWKVGDPYVRLWGEHRENPAKKLFYKLLMRRVELPAFRIDQHIDHIARVFEKVRPKIVEAYTSAAVHLARICRDQGRHLPHPQSIIVSAETLREDHRALIEEALGGKVYNRYGSREFGNVAHECRFGHLHINAESFFIEEEAHPSIPGAKNLLITFLDNYSMPFIRYRCGDLGLLSSASCDCGLGLPLLARLDGRNTDFFLLSNGHHLSFLFFNWFFEQYGSLVDFYQVVQKSQELIQILLVPSKRFSSRTEMIIKQRLVAEFDGSTRFEISLVNEIPREKSGKLRIYKPLCC